MVEIIQGLTALFCSSSRLTLPAPSPSTWLTDTRWTEPQRRSLNATGTWTSSSTMRESVSGGTSWTPASQCSEMSWRQIISGPSLSHKVSQLGSTALALQDQWMSKDFYLFFLAHSPILVSAQSQLSCPPWLDVAAATSLPSAAFRARSPFLTDQLVGCLFPLKKKKKALSFQVRVDSD